ncbi:unnamed protein product, partial [marine sediment metagenome]
QWIEGLAFILHKPKWERFSNIKIGVKDEGLCRCHG